MIILTKLSPTHRIYFLVFLFLGTYCFHIQKCHFNASPIKKKNHFLSSWFKSIVNFTGKLFKLTLPPSTTKELGTHSPCPRTPCGDGQTMSHNNACNFLHKQLPHRTVCYLRIKTELCSSVVHSVPGMPPVRNSLLNSLLNRYRPWRIQSNFV